MFIKILLVFWYNYHISMIVIIAIILNEKTINIEKSWKWKYYVLNCRPTHMYIYIYKYIPEWAKVMQPIYKIIYETPGLLRVRSWGPTAQLSTSHHLLVRLKKKKYAHRSYVHEFQPPPWFPRYLVLPVKLNAGSLAPSKRNYVCAPVKFKNSFVAQCGITLDQL